MGQGDSRIWWAQLEKLLRLPFGLAPQMPKPALPLHPQDVSLIRKVAREIGEGHALALWAPYITAESVAFLARALAVGTVNRPKIALYSPDLAVPRVYSSLYGVATSLGRSFPMRTQLPYARSLSQLEFCAGRADSVVLDGRRWRTSLQVQKAVEQSKRFPGARIFLLRDGWTKAASALASAGVSIEALPAVGETLPNGWPALAPYLRRANHFAARSVVSPLTVLAEAAALRSLERSATRLLRAAHGRPGSGAIIFLADTANTLLQNACFPPDLYKKAAATRGVPWADRFAEVLQTSLAYACPDELRGLVYGFLNDFRVAWDYLGHEHPPKVPWIKDLLLRAGREAHFAILCTAEIEVETVRLWSESSAAEGCARLSIVGRGEVENGSTQEVLLVPGPVRPVDSWMLVSGIAAEVRVIAYPWQANRWQYLKRRVGRLSRNEVSSIEDPDADQIDIEYSYWPTLTFESPIPLGAESDFEAMAREIEGRTNPLRVMVVKTDKGDLRYRENALVPTVELNRLVDRVVTLLKAGDRILVRNDGGEIDARGRVDELARSDPVLSTAAERAAVWRDLLTARWKAESCSVPELYRLLFSEGEVTYPGFRDWIVNPHRIGPNNVNIIRLLTRLGLPHDAAAQVREDLRVYRSYRSRVYDHLWKVARRRASLVAGPNEIAEPLEDDTTVDPELGLTLLGLEDLVAFASVLEPPTLARERST